MIQAPLTDTEQHFVLWALVAVLGILAGVVVWAARALIEARDGVRSVKIALYGDPDSKEPNGLKRDVRELIESMTSLTGQVTGHIAEEMTWREENAASVNRANGAFQKTLFAIEDKLLPFLTPKRRRS